MSDDAGPDASPATEPCPPPTELRVSKDRRTLTVGFPGGESYAIPAELLRVESPSAEVQGHAPSQKVLVAGKRDVAIIGVEPVGNYAVRLRFDDLHATGIYPWGLLRRMGRGATEMMADYEARLAERGLSRAT